MTPGPHSDVVLSRGWVSRLLGGRTLYWLLAGPLLGGAAFPSFSAGSDVAGVIILAVAVLSVAGGCAQAACSYHLIDGQLSAQLLGHRFTTIDLRPFRSIAYGPNFRRSSSLTLRRATDPPTTRHLGLRRLVVPLLDSDDRVLRLSESIGARRALEWAEQLGLPLKVYPVR